LALPWQVLPPVGCRDRSAAGGGDRVVRLVALEESDGRHRTITFTLRILPIATLPIATSHRVSATRPGTHSALRISCHLLRLHLTLIRSPPPCRQTRELPGQLKQLRDSESRPS